MDVHKGINSARNANCMSKYTIYFLHYLNFFRWQLCVDHNGVCGS